MSSEIIRRKFLEFFGKRDHAVVPSSSLIPDDPSVLLTTAGMQQFKKYYTGEIDPLSSVHPGMGKPLGRKNAASIQKSFRTSDIDSVGDESHLTFFEMLGNFSFGGYFKKEAITYAYDFIVKELGLAISYVTVFEGSDQVPKDEESIKIWNSLGVSDVREDTIDNVFWGPTGSEGPCGPTTEIYCKNALGQEIEIWNIVFNEFFYPGSREELLSGSSSKKLEKLKTPGVDTGMGFERLLMVAGNKKNIFETDLLNPLLSKISEFKPKLDERIKRILTDHLRAAVFLAADGVRPSNKEADYILRRLLRRILAYQIKHDIHPDLFAAAVGVVADKFSSVYPELKNRAVVLDVLEEERRRFEKIIASGIKELGRFKKITGEDAFYLYESFGLPLELILELAPENTVGELKWADFDREFERHRQVSKMGAEKKFGGHGLILDTGELKAGSEEELKKVTRLHTATHLLQKALREVLGPEVHQAGSDITTERTRFDFTFGRKLTPEEIKKAEDLVNDKIKEDLPMQKIVLPKAKAEKTGALFFFKEKYPDPVSVYFAGKTIESAWSKEFCGGPHVTHTGEVGHFRIAKEEAIGAGTRRIRATVE